MHHPPDPQHVRYASKKYWPQIAADLKTVYTAASENQAALRRDEFCEKLGIPYPAIRRLWETAWSENAAASRL